MHQPYIVQERKSHKINTGLSLCRVDVGLTPIIHYSVRARAHKRERVGPYINPTSYMQTRPRLLNEGVNP